MKWFPSPTVPTGHVKSQLSPHDFKINQVRIGGNAKQQSRKGVSVSAELSSVSAKGVACEQRRGWGGGDVGELGSWGRACLTDGWNTYVMLHVFICIM